MWWMMAAAAVAGPLTWFPDDPGNFGALKKAVKLADRGRSEQAMTWLEYCHAPACKALSSALPDDPAAGRTALEMGTIDAMAVALDAGERKEARRMFAQLAVLTGKQEPAVRAAYSLLLVADNPNMGETLVLSLYGDRQLAPEVNRRAILAIAGAAPSAPPLEVRQWLASEGEWGPMLDYLEMLALQQPEQCAGSLPEPGLDVEDADRLTRLAVQCEMGVNDMSQAIAWVQARPNALDPTLMSALSVRVHKKNPDLSAPLASLLSSREDQSSANTRIWTHLLSGKSQLALDTALEPEVGFTSRWNLLGAIKYEDLDLTPLLDATCPEAPSVLAGKCEALRDAAGPEVPTSPSQ